MAEHPVEVILFVCLVILMMVIFIGILNYRKRKEDAYKTANAKMMELRVGCRTWRPFLIPI